jgi:lysozyme
MNNWGNIFKHVKPGKKTGGFALVVAAGAAIGAPITLNNEGMKLVPYYDSVGVRTWCGGETEIGYKEKFTEQECVKLFGVRYGYYSDRTAMFYNDVAKTVVTPEIHASMVDMSYNVGLPTVQKSSMIRELNAGRPANACAAILLYNKAGGLDCRVRSNNCYGVWDRRLKIKKLCMKGLEHDL